MSMQGIRERLRRFVCCVLLLGGLLAAKEAVAAGKRTALVIGNGAYRYHERLANPANDARLLADKLRTIRFDVIEKTNLSIAQMEEAFGDFLRKSQDAEVALLYYSGHGISLTGNNYLIPVDAKVPRDAFDVPKSAVKLEDCGMFAHGSMASRGPFVARRGSVRSSWSQEHYPHMQYQQGKYC